MFATIEPSSLVIAGAALAWETAAAFACALVLGLAGGALARRRSAGGTSRQGAERERELESLRRVAAELARTDDVEGVVRALLDELGDLFQVGFVALAFVSDDAREASGYLARSAGRDLPWWREVRLDLEREPSGIASAVFEGAAFTVYDVAGSTRVSSRLVEQTGAKSAAYVPLLVQKRVIAVISVATTDEPRAFSSEDLQLMQTLASEGAVALERTRTALALNEALERERLLGLIARRLRSELDLDAALAAAVEETARALGASRCLIQLGEPDSLAAPVAEWHAAQLDASGEEAARLAVVTRAAAEGRVATAGVAGLGGLDESTPEDRAALDRLGSASVVAAPILVFERAAGVLSVHRADPRSWSHGDLAVLEAVAAEVGLAVRLGALLGENREQLAQQGALLRAAQVLSGALELGAVLQRLADQLAQLLEADAADCYLYDADRGTLRCAAVHGFDESLLGFEFAAGRGLAGASIREGHALIESEYGEIPEPVPHPAYAGFTDVIAAPMRWSDQVQGVLGVGRRGGRRFAERDADVLEAFAGLASLALRNAETYTQSSRQARIQRGFYRIASVLGQSLSRSTTLEAVAQAATEALGGASAAVLVPAAGGRLEPVGSYEVAAPLVELLAEGGDEEGAVVRTTAQGRVVASPSLATDDRVPAAWRDAAGEHGYRALLSVPVVAPRGSGGGLVLVFFAEERTFTDEDLELARHLADATRGALERSELFEAERSARALAQQLSRTGRLLTSELDPDAVLEEVVQQAPELLNAEAAAFRLLDGDELVVTAAAGSGAADAIGSRSPAVGWLSGDVVQSAAPVALPEAGEDPHLRGLDPMLAAGHAAYLGVPVGGTEGEPVGVLSVYATHARPWREEEVEALLALAASTAAALANAELYQRVALEKERSVAILANIADGIVAVDRDGEVVLWNAAAERITGIPASAALGRTPAEVLQRNLEAPDGAPPGDRLVPIMRGREEVFLSVTEAVMRDPAGAVAGRIFAFRDISGDRLVEQVKSDFVSTVSHELRTPLTSIYGFAETLLRSDVMFGEEERKVFLGYVASESQRLTAIVDTLLNVARLDTGDLQVNIAETDVRDVVGQVVEQASAAGANGHRFVVELPEEPLAARADPEKLRQVFSILLDNALRYSPDGGTVTVGAARKRDTVEVSVADEGIGIPQSDQEQIFRKFYRGADAELRAGAGGTGLGLFIARGLVTAMGGRIWVTSREGEGSRFSFELPVAAERVEAHE
ncbi:MAG TPA: GAF domain-containing protein [Gaiellaceae bacterium]|nr:GAF domain-containing protein [Gaiellaceae bacterium]